MGDGDAKFAQWSEISIVVVGKFGGVEREVFRIVLVCLSLRKEVSCLYRAILRA